MKPLFNNFISLFGEIQALFRNMAFKYIRKPLLVFTIWFDGQTNYIMFYKTWLCKNGVVGPVLAVIIPLQWKIHAYWIICSCLIIFLFDKDWWYKGLSNVNERERERNILNPLVDYFKPYAPAYIFG